MNFLKEIGIDDNTIEKIIEQNGAAVITNLEANYDNASKIYKILKKININCIDELLIYEIDLFFIDYDILIKNINNLPNLRQFVDSVNDDFFVIEEII